MAFHDAALRSRRRNRAGHDQPARQAQRAQRDRHRGAGRGGRPDRARPRDPRPCSSPGPGTKAFVAGADIGEIGGQGAIDGQARALAGQRMMRAAGAVREAGGGGGQRLRPGRRVRAGHGLPHPPRERGRAVRPAGGEARHRAGLRRHRAAAPAGGSGPRARAAAHRGDDRRPGGLAHRAGEPGRAGGSAAAGVRAADPRRILENGPLAVRACLDLVDAGPRDADRTRRSGSRRRRSGCSARRPTCARAPGRFWRSGRPPSPAPETGFRACNFTLHPAIFP